MKRLIIICEGETEQEFCKDVLQDYFIARNIIIETPKIKKSSGGIVSWGQLRTQINITLESDRTVFVSTLIDYYGILVKHQFPFWGESYSIVDKNERLNKLENAMLTDINIKYQNRFIPYIQLHEFEGLLFNDISVFKSQFQPSEIININELEKIILQYPNPEMINDSVETAPSKRLEKLILGYNKRIYGSIIAESIGLDNIRAKSPRFNNWIKILASI